MKLLVGLGNYGKEFDNTPHNVGFCAVDEIAKILNLEINKKKKNGLVAETVYFDNDIMLVKPQTYMNSSGDCVQALAKKYSVKPQDICIILDNVDLLAGLCRARSKGSVGTHNGMRSIVAKLNTTEFNRIYIGVGVENRDFDLANFVLKKFSPTLQEQVKIGIDKAVEFGLKFLKGESLL